MIEGDYCKKEKKHWLGKSVTYNRVVVSTTGVEYDIGERLGAGGVATVFRARRLSDEKDFVFKEYFPNPKRRAIHNAIKTNICRLMDNPFTDSDGTELKSFVGPADKDSLIELPASKSFGYIMELIDTDSFLSVRELWYPDTYPDAEVLCKICINLANLFRIIHLRGWCYKDINEGNIYINNKTGEVRIADCDNISVQSVETVRGTHGFMAPEIYENGVPDTYTDYFSMAVLFYRLFVDGFPFDGKKSNKYLMDNSDIPFDEAARVIYGYEALFVFDPEDSSNEIRDFVDPSNPDLYAVLTNRWDRLPQEIKNGFIQTFSVGLSNENRHKRTIDLEWIKIFERLKKAGLTKCCQCGRINFRDSEKCKFCRGDLELTTVVFQVKRDTAPTNIKLVAQRKQPVPEIYPELKLPAEWMKIQYKPTGNLLSALNCSQYSWSVSYNNKKEICAPGERVLMKKDAIITVVPRKLQLKVLEIK